MTTRNHILSTLANNKSQFSQFGVRNIGLFGSYQRNEQTSFSDIDFLVDFEPAHENFDNLLAVNDLLEGLFENCKIEVVSVNGLSPYLAPKILKEVEYV